MTDFQSKFVPSEASPAIRSLIARAMQTRARPEDFISLFHPDAVLHMVGDRRECPFYGVYTGHAQILKLLRDVDAEFDRRDHRILNVVLDGDCFALRRLVEIKHRGSAQSELVVIGHFVRTRAGLISEAFEYADTAQIRRLMS
jgi:ketosteroid isomerase-like protein